MSTNQNQTFQDLVNKARVARESNQPNVAIENYKKALVEKKDDWDLHYELAVFYGMQNLHHDALKHFKLLYSKYPKNLELNANIGIALAETGRNIESIKFLDIAFKGHPKFNKIGLLLSKCYRQSKSYDKALNVVTTMLNRNKRDDQAFYEMGLIYQEMKDFPRALECLNNACGLNPTKEMYRLEFSSVLIDQGFFERAEAEIKELLIKNNNSIHGMEKLYEIYEKRKNWSNAVEVLKKLEEIDKSNIEYRIKKGYLLLDIGDVNNAKEVFVSVLSLQPFERRALIGYCNTLEKEDRIEDAKKLLEEYLILHPEDIFISAIYTKTTNININDVIVKKLRQASRANFDDSFVVNESIAKIMNNNEQWDNAFKYFEKSKKIRARSVKEKYDPIKTERDINDLIEIFNNETISNVSKFHKNYDLPIFIFGLPRSGKSVLGRLLSCHKKIGHVGEVRYWQEAFSKISIKYNEEFPYLIRKFNQEDVDEIVDNYVAKLKSRSNDSSKIRLIDTLPYNYLNFALLSCIIPNANFIHCRRGYLDLCLEIYFKNFESGHNYTYDLINISHYYNQYQRIINHWHKILPNLLLDVSFEAVIENPRDKFFEIIGFLGLETDQDVIDYEKLDKIADELKGYKKSIGHWKNYEKHIQALFDNAPADLA